MNNIMFYDKLMDGIDERFDEKTRDDVYRFLKDAFNIDLKSYKNNKSTQASISPDSDWSHNFGGRCEFYNEYYEMKGMYNKIHMDILKCKDEDKLPHLQEKAKALGEYLRILEKEAMQKCYFDLVDFNYIRNYNYAWS